MCVCRLRSDIKLHSDTVGQFLLSVLTVSVFLDPQHGWLGFDQPEGPRPPQEGANSGESRQEGRNRG